jgi:hypothetical protein
MRRTCTSPSSLSQCVAFAAYHSDKVNSVYQITSANRHQINILAFLSSTIFLDTMNGGVTGKACGAESPSDSLELRNAETGALWMSFGFGLANFVFTWIAWFMIDRKAGGPFFPHIGVQFAQSPARDVGTF